MVLFSVLILLAGDLVRPRIHFRNGYICWYRSSTESLAYCRFQGILGYRKGALRSSWQVWRVVSSRLMLGIPLNLLVGALVSIQIHFRNGCICWYRCNMVALANFRCQTRVGNKKETFRAYLQACRVVSLRSTLVSALILLAGALVRLQSHLRNDCTCWSRCSMKALPNFRCQELVVYRKGGLSISLKAWRVMSEMSNLMSDFILLVGALFCLCSH